jgi:hypothetical protein
LVWLVHETWEEAVDGRNISTVIFVEGMCRSRVAIINRQCALTPTSLTINAIMRSQVQPADRNKDEGALSVDFQVMQHENET